ncbi:MAG: DUF3320 domain-containing protein [Anaerovoracaceae bacterium]
MARLRGIFGKMADADSGSGEKERKAEVIVGKPIDIMIAVDKNKGVSFACEGHPSVTFESLVEGKEIIIGNGFVKNEGAEALPEIRIVCEFEPAIVDPGILYYQDGTFEGGFEGIFDIDDPPVNLEEYAKIKKAKKGKIKFTLYFGETQLGMSECVMGIKPAPEEELKSLMASISYEQEKNSAGPVNVFLYAGGDGRFEMDLMRQPELLYSMYSNGSEQLIGDVYISNETEVPLRDVRFEADFTSDILSSVKVHLGSVPAGAKQAFEVDDPAIDVGRLEQLTEIEVCTAYYRLMVDGRVAAESSGKVTICPYDQWNAALILLPAYMTPNHPKVINVLQNASRWMLVNGMNPSLEGYQSDATRVEEMVGAVFNAVKEANIIYSNPPASFFGPQRIRLCDTVFEQRFATCMDMTILFASCLESFGLHPVLITAPGHIFAGVWLNGRARLSEPILSDAGLIQKYILDGQLIAVECTAMNAGKSITFNDAKQLANDMISELADRNVQGHEAIDVQIAREIGVRPIPIRKHSRSSEPGCLPEDASSTGRKPKGGSKEKAAQKAKTAGKKNAPKKPQFPAEHEASAPKPEYVRAEYRSFDTSLLYINADNIYDKQTRRVLKEAIADIVAVEGPISQPALIRTLVSVTGLGRASRQMTEYLDKLIAQADVRITRQQGVRFLWSKNADPASYMTYRLKAQRDPEDVCKYELKNAVCLLIQENGPMTKEEISRALVQLFGYSRTSRKIEEGVTAAIRAAKELKAADIDDKSRYFLL